MPTEETDLNLQADAQRENTSSDGSGSQPVNWEERYKGLRRTSEKDSKALLEHKAKVTDLAAEKEQLLTEKTLLQQQLDAFKQGQSQSVNAWEQERTALIAKQTAAERKLEVAKTVMKPEFAVLQPLFADDLLQVDGLEGDALTGYLTKFKTNIEAVAGGAVQKSREGATPETQATGGSSAVDSSESLWDKLQRTSPGSKEWDELYPRYEKSLIKKPT